MKIEFAHTISSRVPECSFQSATIISNILNQDTRNDPDKPDIIGCDFVTSPDKPDEVRNWFPIFG